MLQRYLVGVGRWSIALVATLILSWAIAAPVLADGDLPSAGLTKAIGEIEQLDAMRTNLAGTLEGLEGEPTLETMKQVCQPVGMRAKQLAIENGWQVKQLAAKYRNPDHAVSTEAERSALAAFEADRDLMGIWKVATVGDRAGTQYYRRIDVLPACMACHGRESERPQFVKDKYPQDLAYDFAPGDLRGMYSVFIPYLEGDA
jgi:cytochrome c553